MRKLFLLFSVLPFSVFSILHAASVSLNNPDALLKLINDRGARYVVRDVFWNWKDWEKLLDVISTGNSKWVKIAVLLRPETDAGKTTGLQVAMAYALPNAPENVLPTIGHGFEFDDVCGFPFIEPEQSFLKDHYEKSMKALEKPLKPELEELRLRCKSEIHARYQKIIKVNVR